MREGVRGGRGDDEREARDFGAGGGGATTTIFRSGSNGSLQQQALQQNGGVAVSIQYSPAQMRKTQKMILQGSREKEKFLPWICKVVGRRRVGMLLLAIVSIVVFLSILSAFSKEDVSETPETDWGPLHPFIDIQKPFVALPSPSLVPIKHEDNANRTLKSGTQSPSAEHVLEDHPEVTNQTLFSSRRYCEHFAIPAPPVDRKRTGPRPCDVCYAPVEHAVALMPASPSISPTLQNLNYFSEGNSYMNYSNEGSDFGGHPSLQQRNESYDIKESMSIHCGFFKGSKPGVGSGFDIEEADLLEMEQCHRVVVASAIFGNYDVLQQPRNISEHAKKNACFYMFVDEETEAYMQNTTTLDSTNKAGIWRIVVVRNLPYLDARRNGKVPKLLLHRLFPKARYSLWIDGKLQLVVDPFQILERFLWRENATFAISRHYRRFDVFVEAEANKAAGKYDNASINRQIEFYKNEGLTHYSVAKLPITSDVPEGCVIVKEHIPITNLFTCLWFNEVDRFTSRDQISFSTVRDKIMSRVNWSVSMFLDCERRNFVIQAYHRDLLEQMKLEQLKRTLEPPPPPPLQLLPPNNLNKKPLPEFIPERFEKTPPRKPTSRRERRSSSRHRRPRVGKDSNSI